MRHHFLVTGAVLGGAFSFSLLLLLLLPTTGCQEPDPTFGDPGGILGRKLPGEQGAVAATSGGPAATTVFGTPYNATDLPKPPTLSLKTAHAAKSQPDPAAAAGLDCLTCHKTGGAAATKTFTFGGFITDDKGAAAAAADVIVITAENTKIGPVKSDADGFFWFEGGPMPKGAHVTVRKEAKETPMTGQLQTTDGACQAAGQCHGGAQGKVHF